MALHKYAPSIIVGFGLTMIVIGTWLPWIRVNPNLAGEPIPDILLPHMHIGFEWGSGLVIIPLALLLSLALFWSRPVQRQLLIIGAGMWALIMPLNYLRELSLVGFQSTFVPWIGWYLTVAGGLLLLVGGGTALWRFRNQPSKPTTGAVEHSSS